MLQKGWTPKKQTIDFAPIEQTPFKDYLMGEQMLVNDPKFGPWTPEEYEKYKYTKTSDWLKEHPEDWSKSANYPTDAMGQMSAGPKGLYKLATSMNEMATPAWAGQLIENEKPAVKQLIEQFKQGPPEIPTTGEMLSSATSAPSRIAQLIADLAGGAYKGITKPAETFGPHPENVINLLLSTLPFAKGLGAAPKATPLLESPEAMYARYNRGAREPAVGMGQKQLPPASAETIYTDLQRTFEPGMQRADRLAAAQKEQFVNQLMEKIKAQPPVRMLPPGKAIPMGPTAESLRGKFRPTNKLGDMTDINQPLLAGAEKKQFIKQLMDKLSAPEQRLLPETTGGTPMRAWESSRVMGNKYDPTMSPTSQPVFNPEAASLDAALKEVDDILGGAKTTYISKEARMQKLLKQIFEMIGKNK